MRKSIFILAAAIQFVLSGCGNVLTVDINNPLAEARHPELIELEMSDVTAALGLGEEDKFVITSEGNEIPYQITYDSKVVFPATLAAEESQTYTIKKGNPSEYVTKVRGDHYPARVDDICWENDIVGFRVYGFKEDNPSGYDIFTKKNSDLPVIPEMYRKALDPEMKALQAQIKTEFGADSAAKFNNAHMSFHIDHGYGADFYAVGPTLGAGTSALLDGEQIIYPFCFETFEILDNGPLRFTLKLTFRPFKAGESENVVETRIISIDLGSHFTKTAVSFENLDKKTPIVTGIVVQDKDGKATGDAQKGYIAYPAPTMNFDKFQDIDNGIIFVGHVFPESLQSVGLRYFSEDESKSRGGSKGHMLAHSTYSPGESFVYYWGFGWDGADMKTYEQWIEHLDTFSAQLRTPIIVNLK